MKFFEKMFKVTDFAALSNKIYTNHYITFDEIGTWSLVISNVACLGYSALINLALRLFFFHAQLN